jgi:hypothetical protein
VLLGVDVDLVDESFDPASDNVQNYFTEVFEGEF